MCLYKALLSAVLLPTLKKAHEIDSCTIGIRCIVLESAQKNEAAWLMAAYSPVLANGLADEPPRRAAPASERSRLAAALKSARRALVDSGMLRRPTEASAGNFLRNTLRR